MKRVGGTIDDTVLVDGLVLPRNSNHSAGGAVSSVKGAKILLIQFCLSPPKTNIEQSIVISDYSAMDRILRQEKKYILDLIRQIKKTGCNVLLIQKSILRDAVNELALHYLARSKIMVITDIERDDVEFICKSLTCQPVATPEQLDASKVGMADLVEEVNTGEEKVVKVTGIAKPGQTVSVLVRGSNTVFDFLFSKNNLYLFIYIRFVLENVVLINLFSLSLSLSFSWWLTKLNDHCMMLFVSSGLWSK